MTCSCCGSLPRKSLINMRASFENRCASFTCKCLKNNNSYARANYPPYPPIGRAPPLGRGDALFRGTSW